MKVLFVHGMGRSRFSGWPLLWRLRRAGLITTAFGYHASARSFDQISNRLSTRIANLLVYDELILVGHSLGGVLLRDALRSLPLTAIQPKHLFLLGSPIGASQLAARLAGNAFFRLFARDCGALLGSVDRMAAIGAASIPTTSIAGIRGIIGGEKLFNGEPNDGVVSISEVSAPWLHDQEKVPVAHTLLPSSKQVASVILQRLGKHISQPPL